LTCAFHPSGVVGMTFHVGVSGDAISFCICGLTVSGTGIIRAGTSRGGVCAAADDVETANAMPTPALNPRQALTCDMAFMMSSQDFWSDCSRSCDYYSLLSFILNPTNLRAGERCVPERLLD